jgi:hypothetical protein
MAVSYNRTVKNHCNQGQLNSGSLTRHGEALEFPAGSVETPEPRVKILSPSRNQWVLSGSFCSGRKSVTVNREKLAANTTPELHCYHRSGCHVSAAKPQTMATAIAVEAFGFAPNGLQLIVHRTVMERPPRS